MKINPGQNMACWEQINASCRTKASCRTYRSWSWNGCWFQENKGDVSLPQSHELLHWTSLSSAQPHTAQKQFRTQPELYPDPPRHKPPPLMLPLMLLSCLSCSQASQGQVAPSYKQSAKNKEVVRATWKLLVSNVVNLIDPNDLKSQAIKD